jgi:hypothetical protein
MKRVPLAFASIAAVTCAAIAVASPALAAWSTSPSVNLPVRVALNYTNFPFVIPDGSGGAMVAWTDSRNSVTTGDDVYAAHILKSGVMDPAWPVNGLLICNAAGNQEVNSVISDGAGGIYIAWDDTRGATADIYVARVNSNGTFPAGWTTANGKLVGAATPVAIARDDNLPVACTDGAGGVIVAWVVTYTLNSDYDIYANHILANGSVAGGWQTTGSVIDGNSGIQDQVIIAEDGLGGAYVVFRDTWEGPAPQIRYRTVTGANALGTPSPDALVLTNADQEGPVGAADGLGGMFVAWRDARVVPHRVALNDITPAGVNGTPFGLSGLLLGQTTDYDFARQILSDGNGGAYVTWLDSAPQNHEHISHVNGNATVANGWSANGNGIGMHSRSAMVPDGTGGVLVAYSDESDIYGIRYLSGGGLGLGWGFSTFVCNAPNYQSDPSACSDGANGMIAVWGDGRDSYRGMNGIYAQRIDRFGALGDASPGMAGVKDIPNDQGGHVRVSWNPSYFDADPTNGISNYYVYRQVPTHFAVQQVRAGRMKVAADGAAPLAAGELRVTRDAVTTYYWEQIATVPAMELPGYSLDASTAADSVPGSNPYTLFMVEAMANSGAYWMSAPDSGYSKDNLPPLPPAPVSAAYNTGGTTFHWAPNGEGDLANYRIYRGTGLSFVPGPGNLIASPTDTTYFDATSSTHIYKMSAVDAHGNESAFTTITPSGVLDSEPAPPRELAFAIASRNPAPGSVTFRLTLPAESNVRLALYDAMGRRVRALANGTLPAGDQTLRWDGTDDGGRAAPSGLYFARFDGAGRTLVRRLVIER